LRKTGVAPPLGGPRGSGTAPAHNMEDRPPEGAPKGLPAGAIDDRGRVPFRGA